VAFGAPIGLQRPVQPGAAGYKCRERGKHATVPNQSLPALDRLPCISLRFQA